MSVIRFVVTGGLNTVIDLAVFALLYFIFEVHLILANVLAFLVAVTNSYLMNRYWSFAHLRSNKHTLREYIEFVSASIFAVFFSTAILVFGQAYLAVGILKLLAAIVTPIVNFLLYRFLVFAPRAGERNVVDR